jgi:predicted PurR-regulated permease PerM
MQTTGNSFLIDLLIAVLAYFLFSLVINAFVKDPRAHEIFTVILIIACVIYALFGQFFPFFR